ncbi:hypothetical protein CFOL_v3_26990 [Cephalotus follicularis]|uniref:Uncharacterized protein n=1 Tax=Cephalotus follicularis TaxID=3775 RepID=A0A1Q3CTG6_CEPFO|nr:hypothetical protein CFOL_v3_26990 [Cephalotus follicularis]
MTSYPPPNRKGSFISLFWSIFNMGGLIPFILNYHRRCTNIKYSSHCVFVLIYAYFFQPMKRRHVAIFSKEMPRQNFYLFNIS